MATTATQLEPSAVEEQVLEIVRELLTQMGNEQAARSVTLHSSLERDLGIASLDLVELLVRCEARFEIELPDEIAEQAETPAGWVKAILQGGEEATARPAYRITPPGVETPPEPVSAGTLVQVLAHHAEADAGRVHINLLDEDSGQGITYSRLYEEASSVAAGLAAQGLRRNETVALMLPSNADFFYAFFGVMMAGGIAVPIYPPTRPDRIEEYVRRQVAILRNARIRFLITFEQVRAVSQIMRVNLPSLIDVTTVAALRQSRARLGSGAAVEAEAAVLQYTSGSTGDPKGVVLTHANILANIRAIGAAVDIRPGDAVVSWLPLSSDAGLIASWLFSLYYAAPITILSPLDFLHRPERWLWAIHDSRGTLAVAPNFAYELCARRIPAWTLEGADLSCWRVAVNAGEPVLSETVARFSERFAAFGFRPESMLPCYGLAESSVALAMPEIGRLPVVDRVSRPPFETKGRAEPASPDDPNSICFYSVGRPVGEQEIRIVDSHNRDAGERVQGRLLFRGPSTTSGYYRNFKATSAVMTADGWMDSGDLAYQAGGEVFITNRAKESIIKAGRNISPVDVEGAVNGVAGVLRGSSVAFGVPDGGAERLIVAAETRATSAEDFYRIEVDIVRIVEEMLGVPPDGVRLLAPGSLPKTSNGKIRRNDTRALFLKGKLPSGGRPPWLQIVRLWRQNLGPLVALGLRRVVESVYRGGVSAVASLVAVAGGVWVRFAGHERAIPAFAGWLLRIHGRRFTLHSKAWKPGSAPVVFVANRAGWIDPLVLAAVLPGPLSFVGSEALRGLPSPVQFLLRTLVLDTGRQSEPETPEGAMRNALRQALRDGRRIVALPEGPIGSAPYRCRFRLDAFHAAIETGAALQPVAVRERSSFRRSGNRVGIQSVSEIILREALNPDSGASVVCLRDQVRAAIGRVNA